LSIEEKKSSGTRFKEQKLPDWRRAVLKVGSSLLAADGTGLDPNYVLARVGALPIVNENDTVSVDELRLGDNDNLAAIVAALCDADLLLIATDIDGLYTANPRVDPDAEPILQLTRFTRATMDMAGGAGTASGTGGMRTKLEAAIKAANADTETVSLLSENRLRGTRLRPTRKRLTARKYWLRHVPLAPGAILIDGGAARALKGKGASLLPLGIVGALGEFARGDMIEIICSAEGGERRIGRGLTQYSAVDIRRIAQRHTRDIESVLGYHYGESVVHRDDMVTG
jgi:glutamate 5-kinase